MPLRLSTNDQNFESAFQALLVSKRESSQNVNAVVADIVGDIQQNGDAALLAYTERFDRLTLNREQLRIGDDALAQAEHAVDPETLKALQLAHIRIHAHHQRQLPHNDFYTDPIGVQLGTKWTPIQSVGLYVPGGTASYPSSVLMNAVPAKVAGVERIVMVVPAPDGVINPLVLCAANLAGVDEVYQIGGAQAVAALAHGTQTIKPVAKIMGPGNAYVAAAKRQVFGTVGIDMIAGPSEVLILADAANNPDWLAIDLLAQAEHDTAAQSILITDDADLAEQVEKSVANHLKTLPRADIARQSWEEFGAIILVDHLEQSIPMIDALAPEHLEIATDDPEFYLNKISNAGAVFLGQHTPEAIGDYVGGSNHVLPTARSARFASGLSVLDFMKKTSVLKCGPEQLSQIGPAAMQLAQEEGLDAHGRSIGIRMNLRS